MIKSQLTPKVKKKKKKIKVQTYGQGCNCDSLCERKCAVCSYMRTHFSLGKIRKVYDIEEIVARATCSVTSLSNRSAYTSMQNKVLAKI